MLLTPHTVSGLTHVFVAIGAFLGPARNPGEAVPFRQKADALVRLVQTGDDRACKDVLAAIRAKKAREEKFLRSQVEAKKGLEEGIAKDREFLPKAGKFGPQVQKRIDGDLRTLGICASQVERYGKLVRGRAQEEQAFAQAYRLVWDARAWLPGRNAGQEKP